MSSDKKLQYVEAERRWWDRHGIGPQAAPPRGPNKHDFAHSCVRSRLYDTLTSLGCDADCSLLDVGCGSGEDATYVQRATGKIMGVDVSSVALRSFVDLGFPGVAADAERLPFRDNSFDYVLCSGLLHHLVLLGDLGRCVSEFTRVAKPGGHVITLEPNLFNISGAMMNLFNSIRPGITGLVPHERALSPLHLGRVLRRSGLEDVGLASASYVWNRLPLALSKLIFQHENRFRLRKPFNLFGWFVIVHGRKPELR